MKSLKYLLGLCLLAFIMSSCQSKEERVIKSLESLCMQVEQRADQFTEKDWENVITKFEKIHSDALDCDFTEEQLKEFGRFEGKLSAAIAKEGSKNLGRKLQELINKGKSVIEGFIEGFGESTDEDEES